MEGSRGKRVLTRLGEVWIALGLAFAGFLLLNALYVIQRNVRVAISGSEAERETRAAGHPYRDQLWYRQLLRERDGQRQRFDPWRVWWSYPLAGRYVNVDSAGRRVTVQAYSGAAPSARIIMLGASAMWGYTSRDSLTVPSLVARAIAEAGTPSIEVVNLAQPGYTVAQELATLLHELGEGPAPTVAVFLDGINDIRTALLYGEPGHIFFERRLRYLYEVEAKRGLLGGLAGLGQHSALINRLLLLVGGAREWREPPAPPDLCDRLARYYRRQATLAMALGAQAGVDVLVVQQPMHATTGKRLSAFERGLDRPDRMERMRGCGAAIDSAMAPAGPRYLSLRDLFDGDTATVFLDSYGHVTESGNQRMASRIAAEVARLLKARAAPPTP